MVATAHKPVLIVIAGPNGSGKTTITTQILQSDSLPLPSERAFCLCMSRRYVIPFLMVDIRGFSGEQACGWQNSKQHH